MTTDLDDRLRRTLTDRAATAGVWSTPGGVLRERAESRARRRQLMAVGVSAVAVLALMATATTLGPGESHGTPADVRPTVEDRQYDLKAAIQVPVPDGVVRDISNQLGLGDARLTATAKLPLSGDVAMLFTKELPVRDPGRLTAMTVTYDGTSARAGTVATIADSDPVIALPVRDLGGAALFVLAPLWADHMVEVTTAAPGEEPEIALSSLDGPIALVAVPGPDVITGLRVLASTPDRSEKYRGIPGAMLPVDLPVWLPRIAAWSGHGVLQSVQVRTDGTTACRLTVGGLGSADAFAIDWNLFDAACAPVDAALHLLLAEDRRYSSVAGVAPAGTVSVRLRWEDGSATDVPVSASSPFAFIDTSGRPPEQLLSAEALTETGDVAARWP